MENSVAILIGAAASAIVNLAVNYWNAHQQRTRAQQDRLHDCYDLFAQIVAKEIERFRSAWAMVNMIPADDKLEAWNSHWKTLEDQRHANRIQLYQCASRLLLVENNPKLRDMAMKLADSQIFVWAKRPDAEEAKSIQLQMTQFRDNFQQICAVARTRFQRPWLQLFSRIDAEMKSDG